MARSFAALALTLALALLSACEGEPGGELLLSLERDGVPLNDGDPVPLEFGCQGGAHIFLDVVVIGNVTQHPVVDAQLDGVTQSTTLGFTEDGAALRNWMFVVATFTQPGFYSFPETRTLSATARERGREARAERIITLVEGETCDPTCDYDDTLGTARLTEVVVGEGTGCDPVRVAVTMDFEAPGGAVDAGVVASATLPFDCVAAHGLAVDASVPAVRQDITRGTCSPVTHDLRLDPAPCDAICPAS